jgi:myxalamid-type polyketide synthase MxaB
VVPRGGGARAQPIEVEALLALPRSERDAGIRAILRAKVAQILRFDSADDVEPDARFVELGLDSLAAVELKNALESAFRVPLPTSTLFDYPAIRSLTERISQLLAPSAGDGGGAPAAAPADPDIGALSDGEADAELAALRGLSL